MVNCTKNTCKWAANSLKKSQVWQSVMRDLVLESRASLFPQKNFKRMLRLLEVNRRPPHP